MKVDYFVTSEEMICIKVPFLRNFKVEPLENFDEDLLYDDEPLVRLEKGAIRGCSKWIEASGSVIDKYENGKLKWNEKATDIIWKDCEIIDYNSTTKKFTI